MKDMLDWRPPTDTNVKIEKHVKFKSSLGRVVLSSCTCTYNTCAKKHFKTTMCTLRHLWQARRRGSQCCVTLADVLRVVSVLKIPYHRKFSEGNGYNESHPDAYLDVFKMQYHWFGLVPGTSLHSVTLHTMSADNRSKNKTKICTVLMW